MNPDPGSLANLRDIVTPPPVPWWPPAPGWWLVLMLLGLFAVLAAFRGWRRWRANVYRRAALRALREADSVASVAEILKRAALMATSRAQVASLSGSAWVQWLASTGGRPVPPAASQFLSTGMYNGAGRANVKELTDFAAQWIRAHRLDDGDRGQTNG
jgi:hypothetical protein